jgi:alkylhydroperoxidase family enzyme
VNEFLAAGDARAQQLDVLIIVALKAISNYTNHLAKTPLDDAFASQKWTRPN